MEKKFYEVPELEVLDLKVEGFFCASIIDQEEGFPSVGGDEV